MPFSLTRIWLCILLFRLDDVSPIIVNKLRIQRQPHNAEQDITISKVSLTQRGYIQFLRYINDVPPLHEYTFCIWVNSNNFTFNHPLLSYSKHEEKRLIRVWISPYGHHINLEILEVPIFSIPVDFIENRWYHICQSWATLKGSWSLFLDGKLKASGYEEKLRGAVIESGGDIVVGQEYTDFDKGLDDGIEGDIFGFNFVLSSTHPFGVESRNRYPSIKYYGDNPPRILQKPPKESEFLKSALHQPGQVPDETVVKTNYDENLSEPSLDLPKIIEAPKLDELRDKDSNEVPDVLHYFSNEPNREPKGILNIFDSVLNYFQPEQIRIPVYKVVPSPAVRKYPSRRFSGPSLNSNNIIIPDKALGLMLVELSFKCALKKGAPLRGRGVLINWTDSPVRVFGGAMLKNIRPFC